MDWDLEAPIYPFLYFVIRTNQVPVSTVVAQAIDRIAVGEGNVWARDNPIGLLPLQSPSIRSFDGELQQLNSSTAQELEMKNCLQVEC